MILTFKLICLNAIKSDNTIEKKIVHMNISWNTRVYLKTRKRVGSTPGHIGFRSYNTPHSSERLQSPSVCFTAEFVRNM